MPSVVRAVVEAVRDPLAQKLTQSRKYAWNLADVFKSILSGLIAGAVTFIGMLPVIEILQLVAGHSEQFGENGPLVSAVCVLLIQLYRTFHQGKPDDNGNSSTPKTPVHSPSPTR